MAEPSYPGVTGRQLHAARVFAGLSQIELAAAALCNPATVGNFEQFGPAPIKCQPRTLLLMELALKTHGVAIGPGSVSLVEAA